MDKAVLDWLLTSDPAIRWQVMRDLAEGAVAMITVSAFEALVFGLLPIHGMPGRVLFGQRRWLWVAIWGISLLAFFRVLVNPQSGYLVDSPGPGGDHLRSPRPVHSHVPRSVGLVPSAGPAEGDHSRAIYGTLRS
jgi:hypothetical protein